MMAPDAIDEIVDALDRYLDARYESDRVFGRNGTAQERLKSRAALIDLLLHYFAKA